MTVKTHYEPRSPLPLDLASGRLPRDAVQAWATAKASGVDANGWVVIGMVGPVILVGHQNLDAKPPTGLPQWQLQKVKLTEEDYRLAAQHGLGASTADDYDGRIPESECDDWYEDLGYDDYVELLLSSCYINHGLSRTLEQLSQHKDIVFTDLPTECQLAYYRLLHKVDLVDMRCVNWSEKKRSLHGNIQSEYQCACVYSDDDGFVLATSKYPYYELEDALSAQHSSDQQYRIAMSMRDSISAFNTEVGAGNEPSSKQLRGVKRVFRAAGRKVAATVEIDADRCSSMNPRNSKLTAEDLIQWAIYKAMSEGSSDIHIETDESKGRIRIRIDGDLQPISEFRIEQVRSIISVVKTMSKMKLDSHRPQDGRMTIEWDQQVLSVRVSSMPVMNNRSESIHKMVLRILGTGMEAPRITQLELEHSHQNYLMRAIKQKQGLVIVTGPTGSGKTTTLAACLSHINRPEINIQTLEDPIEYEIPGVNHTQIDLDMGVTFEVLMRSVLRQDPDVVLMGEMRDPESAQIATDAAMTGHLVLTTLHTNNALESIRRMSQLKVPVEMVESSLVLLQAQRLVKKLCPSCKVRIPVDEDVMRYFNAAGIEFDGKFVYEAMGCENCKGTGYKGRRTIMEIIPIDDDYRELIGSNASYQDFVKLTKSKGHRDLFQDAMQKVADGETSLTEVERFTNRLDI